MWAKHVAGLAVSTYALAVWSADLSGRHDSSFPDLASVLLATSVLVVGGFASIALHEAAHARSLQRSGTPVVSVRIGLGPLLGSATVRHVPVQLRALPLSGETRYAGLPSVHAQRAFLRAGPRVHLVLVAPALAGALTTHGVLHQLLVAVVLHQAWLWLSNVLPLRPSGSALGTDGWQLRALRKGIDVNAADTWAAAMAESDRGSQSALLAAADARLATDLTLAQSVTAQGMRFVALDRSGDYAAVVDGARELADTLRSTRPESAREVRYVAADSLLTGALLGRLHPGAQDLAAAAQEVARAPRNDRSAHARATALVLQGRPDEAVPLLRAIDLPRAPLVDRAAVLGTLALALTALGRFQEAAVLIDAIPPWSPYRDALVPGG